MGLTPTGKGIGFSGLDNVQTTIALMVRQAPVQSMHRQAHL